MAALSSAPSRPAHRARADGQTRGVRLRGDGSRGTPRRLAPRRPAQAIPLRRRQGQSHHRRTAARADRAARHPTRLAGRVDLADRVRAAAGDRDRRGRASPVPLPPRLPRRPGAGEVRPARPLRRAAARVPGTRRGAPRARAVRARVGLRARRDARQPRLVPGGLGAVRAHRSHLRHHDAHEAARRRFAASGSASATAASTVSSSGRRSSTPSSPRRCERCSASKAAPGSFGSSATGRART